LIYIIDIVTPQDEATLLLDSKNDLSYGFKSFAAIHNRLSLQCQTSKALAVNCCIPHNESKSQNYIEGEEEDKKGEETVAERRGTIDALQHRDLFS
jgi:hypothetical protein